MRSVFIGLALSVLAVGPSTAQTKASTQASIPVATTPKSDLQMTREEGGAVTVDLGHNIRLNDKSSLKREYFVIRDPAAPVWLAKNNGVFVSYESGSRTSSGSYQYNGFLELEASEPITAVQVKAHIFDVFGRPLRTLAGTWVQDVGPGAFGRQGKWRIFSENEAEEAHSSVMYVSQVRLASGRIYAIDQRQVLDQVRKVAARITEADLEPKKPREN